MGDGLSSDASGTETVLTPETKRKLKLVPVSSSDGTIAAIMMDRNLGAYEGAFNAIPKDILTMSRNNGFHFQKGRKDPFPSSYTTQKLVEVYKFILSEDAPPKHIMNRYKPDGFHAIVPKSLGSGAVSLQTAYRNPVSIAGNSNVSSWNHWCNESNPRPVWGVTKTIHDPCPAGWRIPQQSELTVLAKRNPNKVSVNTQNDGGLLLKYDDTDSKFYLRYTGYPPLINQLNYVGTVGYITAMGHKEIFEADSRKGNKAPAVVGMEDYDAHTTRCVQEK